jgi:hypothetical protein
MYTVTILDLGTSWRGAISFTPRPLYPSGKSHRFPLHMMLDGTQSRHERCGEKKNLLPLPGTETRRYTD